jgi:prepilin-type N-terminal cleavage/methylation domain-containing protein
VRLMRPRIIKLYRDMRKTIILPARAFSLLELMIVIVIVGILATIAIQNFTGPKESSLEKEAKTNLKLIAAAEKIYRMEVGGFYTATNETDINSVLRLMLPAGANKNWNYTVSSTSTTFNATVTRISGPKAGTVYSINQTAEEPQ